MSGEHTYVEDGFTYPMNEQTMHFVSIGSHSADDVITLNSERSHDIPRNMLKTTWKGAKGKSGTGRVE